MRSRLLLLSALWWLAAPAWASADAGPRSGADAGLRWIYVESNVGGSSGGHVALQVRETIYHVQQGPDGRYELNRDAWETFRHLYAGLQNRRLHLASIDVAADDLARIERRMARAYVAQQEAHAEQARLRLDRAWLEAWRNGGAVPALPSAGLLSQTEARDADAEDLRDDVADALGRDFVTDERARLADAIARFDVADGDLLALREQLLLAETLRALDEAWGIAPGALLPIDGRMAEPLTATERAAARRFAAAQREAVVALLGSARPDRAGPLLLALARHQALARSARTGRLVLLDPYAGLGAEAERERLTPTTAGRLAAELEPVVREGRGKVLAGRRFDEARYNLLELGTAVWREFADGARGRPVRKLPRKATPAAPREIAFVPPGLTSETIESAVARTERALTEGDERLRARYRYGVLQRNCVTELVRLLNASFEPGEVADALGASLEPGAGLGFIPFVFYDQATARLRVREAGVVPSHRERELARLAAVEPGVAWRLRETSTLTSAIYEPRPRDGWFLFFTDDVFWRRPLLGLVNLGYALGSSVPGLLTAPFDGAARLRAAGSGIWYSLPELFFFNIRKGSFEYVPPDP